MRDRRTQAVLSVGAVDKEIKDALKDVPPLNVGDVYVTEPFQWESTNQWFICYYIVAEQRDVWMKPRLDNTDGRITASVSTLHFVVESGHNHKYQCGFNKSYPKPHNTTWEYNVSSRRWTLETDWNHDMPRFLCNLAEDKDTKEYWGQSADNPQKSTIKSVLSEELMLGMRDLTFPSWFAKDEVKLDVSLRVLPEIYCLRIWATIKAGKDYDGLPDWMFVNGGVAQPFRWYSSDGRYSAKGMFILTEEGWLDYELEPYTPYDAENTSEEDMANWASHLELVEYDKE